MRYTLHIDDNIYEVPTKLTIGQFKELGNWDIRVEENWRKIMSIVMKVPYHEVMMIPDKTIELAIAFLAQVIYPDVEPKKLYDINVISVGLFVDMEVMLNDNIQNNIMGIISRLFEIDVDEDMLLEDYWGGVKYYLNWRLNIFNSYRKLFGLDDEFSKNDIELEEKVDPKYNWYQFIMSLADDDFLKVDKVVEKPIIEALNFLAYKKDKVEAEKKRLNEVQRNNRRN